MRFQTLVYLNLLFSLKPGLSLRMEEILTNRQAGSIENKFLNLKVIDLKHDMASLFNPIIINDKFLEGHAKGKYQPKTTKSYLMSLRHFYSFALNNDCGVSISKEHIVSVKRK